MGKKSTTTEEFGYRLVQAVEGHPLAPPTPHGRQAWLREVLKRETGRDVSPNTVHKWFNSMSLPRPDTVRDLARVLKVDELWLAMGHKPVAGPKPVERAATAAAGALLVAGLVELSGGKATFPDPGKGDSASLLVNIGGRSFGVVVAAPQQGSGKDLAYLVPEPVGGNLILGVNVGLHDSCESTSCVDLLDLTNIPRNNMGGFSIIKMEHRSGRAYKADGVRNLVRPLGAVSDLAEELA